MGSCDGLTICPQCGSTMRYDCWYNSNSYIYNCQICGFFGRKMIHYEDCLDREADGVDMDGYSRSCHIGHGVVKTEQQFFARPKSTDDAVVTIDEGDKLCYETYVKDGRLKKIKLMQSGLSALVGMCIIIRKDGTKRLALDSDGKRINGDAASVVDNLRVPPAAMAEMRRKESVLYLCGEDAFRSTIDRNLQSHGFFRSDSKDSIDQEMLSEAKKKFMESYKERVGKDFDFETWISHNKTECPTYGVDNNVSQPGGLDVEIDMDDVKEFYGILSEKSGDILCFSDRKYALRYIIDLIESGYYSEAGFDTVNDYTLIHVNDGIVDERSGFEFMQDMSKCKLEDILK